MSTFKRFLEGRGHALAQDREVVSYYALPHVPDPVAHPAFEAIFQDNWLVRSVFITVDVLFCLLL